MKLVWILVIWQSLIIWSLPYPAGCFSQILPCVSLCFCKLYIFVQMLESKMLNNETGVNLNYLTKPSHLLLEAQSQGISNLPPTCPPNHYGKGNLQAQNCIKIIFLQQVAKSGQKCFGGVQEKVEHVFNRENTNIWYMQANPEVAVQYWCWEATMNYLANFGTQSQILGTSPKLWVLVPNFGTPLSCPCHWGLQISICP